MKGELDRAVFCHLSLNAKEQRGEMTFCFVAAEQRKERSLEPVRRETVNCLNFILAMVTPA